jgi:hypothetical protein
LVPAQQLTETVPFPAIRSPTKNNDIFKNAFFTTAFCCVIPEIPAVVASKSRWGAALLRLATVGRHVLT